MVVDQSDDTETVSTIGVKKDQGNQQDIFVILTKNILQVSIATMILQYLGGGPLIKDP